MMKATLTLFCLCALLVCLVVPAYAQSTRIAVVGDPSLDNLVDLTTAELSKSPNLELVERSELAKLGQEQALQSAVTSSQIPPVQFVPADGLLILRAVKQPDGNLGVFARLVAVQPGVILREVPLPSTSNSVEQAAAIAKEFAPYWSKLAAIRQKKVMALSLLGLRFEVDAPGTRDIERRINVLLASRLGSEPDTVVLERWRLNDAVFEKSLSAGAPASFWTGSSLIDGSMKWADNRVSVKLRVRPPQGTEVSITDSDKADQLPALVARLADKIQAHPIAQGAWQPAAEGGHFAALAKWCLDNGLYDEGAQAIESALALGEASRTTRMLQIRAYSLLTYPTDFQAEISSHDLDTGYGHVTVSRDSLPTRLQTGEQAVNWAGHYLDLFAQASDANGTPEDPLKISGYVVRNCGRLLRLSYEQGLAADHPADVADLRHALQKLIARCDTLAAARPANEPNDYLQYAIQYASLWHDTPEATLDYYRVLLDGKKDGAINRRALFEPGFPILHPPYLDADAELPGAPLWFIASPWIVSWDGRPEAEIKTIWLNFLNQLAASGVPVAQSDALKFKLDSLQSREKRDPVGAELVAMMQQHRDLISGPTGDLFVAGLYPAVEWAGRNPYPTARNALRDLIVAQLKAHDVLPAEWIKDFTFLFFSRGKSDEDQDFVPAFEDYRKWYQGRTLQNPDVTAALADVEAVYVVEVNSGTGNTPAGGFLPVHRHWPTERGVGTPGMPGWSSPPRVTGGFTIADNKLWCIVTSGRTSPDGQMREPFSVMCVDPTNLQTVAACDLPDQYTPGSAGAPPGVSLDVSPDWLVAAIGGHAMLWRRGGKQWRVLDVPSTSYKPRLIGNDLYLLYEYNPQFVNHTTGEGAAATAISGLIHASPADGELENLVSSRRTPPQNALDGKPIGYALDLWGTPEGLMFALNPASPKFQVFAAPKGTNDWKSVESDEILGDVKISAQGTLIGKGFDGQGFTELDLMKGTSSQVLLLNPDHATPANPHPPLWDCGDDLGARATNGMSQLCPVMRGDDLCVYRNVNNGVGDGSHACLYYFTPGQKSAVKIPLEFIDQPEVNTRMETVIGGFQSVQSTDYGLLINTDGFWVVPWSDIDAYRARATGK